MCVCVCSGVSRISVRGGVLKVRPDTRRGGGGGGGGGGFWPNMKSGGGGGGGGGCCRFLARYEKQGEGGW